MMHILGAPVFAGAISLGGGSVSLLLIVAVVFILFRR